MDTNYRVAFPLVAVEVGLVVSVVMVVCVGLLAVEVGLVVAMLAVVRVCVGLVGLGTICWILLRERGLFELGCWWLWRWV